MRYGIPMLCLLLSGFIHPVTAAAAGSSEAQEFSYAGYSELRIDASIFDLEFVPADAQVITLLESNIPSGFTVSHGRQGGRIVVQLQRQMLSLPGWGSGRARLRIAVPRNGVSITARTSTGSIHVQELSGSFELSTSSGEIQLTDSAGSATLRSSTGNQQARNFNGRLQARSTTGQIVLDGFSGRVQASTTTGGIRGSRVRLREDAEFQTTTGGVEITFLNDIEQLGFRLQTTTGTVQIGDRGFGRGEITAGGSGITVFGTTTTGRQTYR
ncbi:DUF4097 family beta strand repeat-containing protein [Spirochaeta africana]|uniref:DUF4097 family beta strand repeat-containing protein n=1 Tax=Spirochaeta africana TaxID=46355 RepID=UPI000301F2B5|nr:DUF4097 family beta strand repeat-containing protein [Spirochaeta africana]